MIKLFPFQEFGRDFLMLRKSAILADDMGLGKTYQALEAIKKCGITSGIIICPQSIRRSWVKRIREQIPLAFIKEITTSSTLPEITAFNVVNYDIVWRKPLIDLFKEHQWPVMVCDEFHFLKNITAKRTKAILGRNGLYSRCDRHWMLSGTPLLNRPIELYPVLRSLFPGSIKGYHSYLNFAYKFCAGYQSSFGFDVSGASNLDILAGILKPIMIRRLKVDVMSELPEVTYDKIYLDNTGKLIKLIEEEKRGLSAGKLIGDISSTRRALGVIKAHAAVKHIHDLLEEKDKLVVFVWHKDVAKVILDAFPGSVVSYTGEQTPSQKDEALENFMNNKNIKLFVGNLKAAGFGIDGLQAVCDICLFVEMSYVPNEIKQAIDRLNRIGQKNPVQVQFLVAEQSIDEQTINKLTEKSRNINTVMGERRDNALEFVQTKCQICKEPTEIEKLKRVLKKTVCNTCQKEMECLL